MHIRRLTDEERVAAFYLSSQAFARGDRDSSRLHDPNRMTGVTYGVWEEERLEAKVAVLEFQAYLSAGGIVPMGGIGGVACLPASRGKGYAGTAMKHVLGEMREAGQCVSTLYPFSFPFYRNLGYEWVGVNRTYRMPSRMMKSDPETEHVRALRADDRPLVTQVYETFAKRYRGMLVRDEKFWNRILNDGDKQFTYTYLYVRDGAAEGYLTYRGGSEEDTHLREFLCLTPRAQRGMLGLLRRHEMQVRKFVWEAPEDDGLWSRFYDWDIETKIEPKVMGRVVDMKAAVEAWTPTEATEGTVTLAVRDEHAPWNAGTWRIEANGGRLHCERTDAPPQVTMDVQAWTQVYFGTLSPRRLLREERAEAEDAAAVRRLEAFFAGSSFWLNDGF